ncbi:MAG: hypothetical protein ACE5FI_04965, partial [Anaerolineales bacterium]
MKRIATVVALSALLAIACASLAPLGNRPIQETTTPGVASPIPNTQPPTSLPAPTAAPAEVAASPSPTETTSPDAGARFITTSPLEGASISTTDAQIVTRLFDTDCLAVVTTPLVIEEFVVFGTHKLQPKLDETDSPVAHCADDPVQPGLYAVSARTGEAFVLVEGVGLEGTPTYAGGWLIAPLVGSAQGSVLWLRGEQVAFDRPLKVGIDSAGLWDAQLGAYIVGSVNSPFPLCQNGPNPDCGALVAVTSQGDVLQRLDRTNGLRGWTTGGPTTDGAVYFMGNGSGLDGSAAPPENALHACSVLRIDRDFNILAAYDDGDMGCRTIGHLESAVVGEVAVAGDAIWAQYLGSTDGQPFAPVARLRAADLTLLCRALIPSIPTRGAAGYYQAPVVDAEGNAYVTARAAENDMQASLFRIGPDCSLTRLFDVQRTQASTPTLADDQYVLLAAGGQLHVIDRQSGAASAFPLGSTADVTGGAVISAYGVSVVSADGVVTTLTKTGLQGYGNAPWPRFRRDNFGS